MSEKKPKVEPRGIPFPLPTESEIAKARDEVYSNPTISLYPTPSVMKVWEGVGWHEDQIYYGILVGLQIAEKRKKKP